MINEEIHTCSYHCENPPCIKRQRDEMRDMMETAGYKEGDRISPPQYKQGGPIEFCEPVFEPDPVETISESGIGKIKKPFDPLAMVTISDDKKPTIEQLLQHLIEVQIDLTNSLTDVAMSNYALVEAMAGEHPDEDEERRYQTLGGEEP